MATTRKLQTNFSAGELSREVEGRPDLAQFFNGALTMENFFPLLEGGCERRPGLRFLFATKFNDRKTILIPFVFNADQAYMIEVGHLYVRFIKGLTQLNTLTGSELVTNGTFNTDIASWTDASVAPGTFTWDTIGAAKLLNATGAARQAITTVLSTVYHLFFDVIGSVGLDLSIGDGASFIDILAETHYTKGSHIIKFTATGTTTNIRFRQLVANGEVKFDNVSVKATSAVLELVTPWTEDDLENLQWAQSADILFTCDGSNQQRELARLGDINWTINNFVAAPPPSVAFDETFSSTLTPSATTGTGVTFTASAADFLAGDIDRQIVFGNSRAVIITVDVGETFVTADIITDFPNTDPIAAGSWALRGTAGTNLDPGAKKEPVGASVTVTTVLDALRSTYVGNFVKVYGGIVELTSFTNAKSMKGVIRTILEDAVTNPVATAAWRLQEPSWSTANGFPKVVFFNRGRLGFNSTENQPGSTWLAASDDLRNFATGSLAADALEFDIKSTNPIRWATQLRHLFVGDSANEHSARGSGLDQPLAGDNIPFVNDEGDEGSARAMPVVTNRAIIFMHLFKKKLLQIIPDQFNVDFFTVENLNIFSRDIAGALGFKQHALTLSKEPDNLVIIPREDGQLALQTFYRPQELKGWCRWKTTGTFESVASIPDPAFNSSRNYCVVRRTINGATVQNIEYFDSNAQELNGREYQSLQTDSAFIYNGPAVTTITGLDHLEGESVAVVTNELGYVGNFTVASNQITGLPQTTIRAEIGIPYTSTLQTMSLALAQTVVQGLPKRWIQAKLRLIDSVGGKINGEKLEDSGWPMFTKAIKVNLRDVDEEGRLTITQDQPYPMKISSLYGEVEIADRM